MSKEKDKNKGLKQFGITTWSVLNRTTVMVIGVIIALAGWTSYQGMPREAFPEVVMPEVYIGTPYPGNSPLDIEKLITRPIEKEVNTITGVDKITSTSVQGYSSISVKFMQDIDPSEALKKVKDKVDIVKSDPDFPKDLPADPNIFEMNFSELTPVMNINLSGDFSTKILEDYAEILEDKIESLPQISKVDIRGVQEREVKINVDVHKMESLNISFYDIENAISSENVSISSGDLLIDGVRRTLRAVGEYSDIESISNTIVKNEKFNIVYLRDIAEVVFEEKERESYARQNKQPVVMLDVIKRAGENLLEASDEINEIIEELQEKEFPESLEIKITSDQSRSTRNQVSELENSIIFGMLLVVLVLLFFLGLRNALFVGVAIPMSMMLSFILLSAMGVTLNMMVLFSLVLALGMLVDNGIVIVENIYRLMDEGYTPIKAAKHGAGEVAWAIIASTATTLAAFVPLALWPGQMGEFMKFLPITLMIVLGSSLFVALVINPVLTSFWMKVGKQEVDKKRFMMWVGIIVLISLAITAAGAPGLGNFVIFLCLFAVINLFILSKMGERFQEGFLPRLEAFYGRFLKRVLEGRPRLILGGTFVLLIASFIIVGAANLKTLFFPENEPNYLNVFIEHPIGTDIEETNKTAKLVEDKVIAYFEETVTTPRGKQVQRNVVVESIIGQVGQGTSDPMEGPSLNATPNKARIQVSFVPYQERMGIRTPNIKKEVTELLKGFPGVVITVAKDPAGPPAGKPINLEITGDDYDQVLEEANKVRKYFNEANIPGIEELKLDIKTGKPEMLLNIDRQKARRFNLSSAQIGMALRTALFGKEISSYKDGEDDYKIMLRLSDETRYNEEALLNTRITFRDQMTGQIRQVPISAVASTQKSSTFSAVKRKDLKRLVTIQSNVLEGFNPTEIVGELKELMEDYPMPEENTFKFTGEQEEMEKNMAFLGTALGMAVFMILLIIVAQFNSISAPVIILSAVMFSLIGVLLGLVIFNMEFIVIMTMIGIISLAGIVVNNAIVLLDYTNLIIDRKKLEKKISEEDRLPFEEVVASIVEGGRTRLRPVLLTAITTILGLLPMAVGLNIDFISLFTELDPKVYIGGDNVVFWGPMSWTIIFGLTFATFLTLVIVPIIYLLFQKWKENIYQRKLRRKGLGKLATYDDAE